MLYLLSVIDPVTSDDGTATEATLDDFNNGLERDGHWVFAGGLGSPTTAAVVDASGPEPVVTDGPYVETKEYVGGLWIVEAADLDVALRLASEGSRACGHKVEVRPFL
jgi:hypothetical protein